MVGSQTKQSNKQSYSHEERVLGPDRPPSYQSTAHPPTIVAEATTIRTEVVTTTTTTTTHFFSLPLWRKRGMAPTTFSHHTTLNPRPRSDELGVVSSNARSSSLVTEKDLPPIPSDFPKAVFLSAKSNVLQQSLPDEKRVYDTHSSHENSDDVLVASPTGDSFPSMQSTIALARASLNLGLPHILPHASPSTEVNTVTYAKSTPQTEAVPYKAIRRIKSSQKIKLSDGPSGENAQRRTRGLSFHGPALLNLGKPETKNKDKEQFRVPDRPSTAPQSVSKSLARRASFWMRKKSTVDHLPTGSSPSQLLGPQLLQLPILQPISPFDENIKSTPTSPLPSSGDKIAHSRGLSRSYSASFTLRPPLKDIESSPSAIRPPTLEGSKHYPSSVPSTLLIEPSNTQNSNSKEITVERRPRAQTNPPLLNRLSLGLFTSSASSSSISPPPLPPTSRHIHSLPRPPTSSSTHSSMPLGGKLDTAALAAESPSSRGSSRPSHVQEKNTAPLYSANGESPEIYVKRLQMAVSKADIAGVLASSSDTFHTQALRTYIGQFNFIDDPLDIALRKLLMEVGLPRETQQIDRVIEAFAGRYVQCNPDLFTSNDHPYILAFSLIMLHTDAFNKSNKRKMSKADYIKNTRLPGVAPQVLDCFYDNIVFVPFIFIEDPLDINGRGKLAAETSHQSIYLNSSTTATPTSTGTPLMKPKVDAYYLITNNMLAPLRVDVEHFIPNENPYSYEGTSGPWDEAQLQVAFAQANEVEVSAAADTARTSPFFSLGAVGGLVSPVTPTSISTTRPEALSHGDVWTLKLTKVGLLNRKDDVVEGGRKATNRKWKQWSVVLTGSQLLFFRDPAWTSSLRNLQSIPSDGRILLPQSALFKPDELISVRNTIAVYDKFYTKHEHTLRLILADGRHLLLQTSSEIELNEWIASINYASTFKSAGIRMRPLEMSGIDVKLTGVAAATSHLHDMQMKSSRPHAWDDSAPRELMGMLSPGFETVTQKSPPRRKLTIDTRRDDMDFEVPVAPEIDGAEQFKATFDQVKADLAAGRLIHLDDENIPKQPPPGKSLASLPTSAVSARSEHPGLPSRTQLIQEKIGDLELRISAVQSQLDNNMRLVRNIAKLTPFQKSTRDRLKALVHSLARHIMQDRLDIVKFTCHRTILANDLTSEGRSWHRARAIAFQAATETLRSRQQETVPRVTLSRHASNSAEIASPQDGSSFAHCLATTSAHMSESSICESFHSALDLGPDWPLSEHTSSFLGTFEPPSSSASLNSDVLHDGNTESQRGSPIMLPPSFQRLSESSRTSIDADGSIHERFYTAFESPEEEAEQWDQTRCAQRVSLVRLPSDMELKTRFSRRKTEVPRTRNTSAGT